MSVTHFRLGKKHAVSDGRTLRAEAYFLGRKLPLACDYDQHVKKWPLLKNDTLGDCGVVAYAHLLQCQSAVADGGERQIALSTAAVEKAYGELSPADDGVIALDALKYFRAHGVGGVHVGAFAAVDFRDCGRLMQAIYQFGGVYAGLLLPEAIAEMDDVWEAPASDAQLKGKWSKGGLGGHLVYLGGYDSIAGHLRGASWGRPLTLTMAFARAYMDECYVMIGETWTNDLGDTPTGANLRQLRSDAERLTGKRRRA